MKMTISTPVTSRSAPLTRSTLWQCEGCKAFVGIQSDHVVVQPICPVCGSPTLELCCHLPTLFGCEGGEA